MINGKYAGCQPKPVKQHVSVEQPDRKPDYNTAAVGQNDPKT
jgi:hypothetical protein